MLGFGFKKQKKRSDYCRGDILFTRRDIEWNRATELDKISPCQIISELGRVTPLSEDCL